MCQINPNKSFSTCSKAQLSQSRMQTKDSSRTTHATLVDEHHHSALFSWSTISKATALNATQLLTWVSPANNRGFLTPFHTDSTIPNSMPLCSWVSGSWNSTIWPGLVCGSDDSLAAKVEKSDGISDYIWSYWLYGDNGCTMFYD